MKVNLSAIAILLLGVFMAYCTAFAQTPHVSGTVTTPSSSIDRPEDVGLRSHTNLLLYEFAEPLKPPSLRGRAPLSSGNQTSVVPEGSPGKGDFFETPASLACVYSLTAQVTGCSPTVAVALPTGGSRAIAVVDAYDDPNAGADLATFDAQFGIAAANFQVVYASGAKPPVSSGAWELEESLDIEWAHAMAPGAALFLVEAASNSNSDLLAAVSVASNLVAQAGGGEVSMSWGGREFKKEAANEPYFQTPGVVYVASSGDFPGTLWPSVSPNVVSAGGTTISRNPSTGAFQQEVAWSSVGSGPSAYFAIPSYQNSVAGIVGKNRGTPDVVFDADPLTGVWIYDSFSGNGWRVVGGTSISAPSLAGIINSAGNFYASSAAELNAIYSSMEQGVGFGDIQSGACYHYAGYLAAQGWDFCSGVGSVSGYQGK